MAEAKKFEERGEGGDDLGRPMAELSSAGLLWLINRVVFHPRGFALALHYKDEEVTGWSLIGDGTELWNFSPGLDDKLFAAAENTLADEMEKRESSVAW